MRVDQTSDQWWKSAVIYCLDVETFMDSDGDGIGDITGLIQRLDHLAGLGVTCLWLMPFQPTPNCDDGYDISDYYAVDPRLGTLGDFVELIRAASDCGLRVIVDLVVNHTSDEHPWFQEARSSRDAPRRGWYVWRDEPSDEPKGLAFPGTETSNWQLDEHSGQYYLHRFYHFQPDLDTANPAVRDEIARIVGFWLALGVSGFRMDAVPAMLETAGLPEHVDKDEPQQWLRSLRAFVNRRRGDALLLGEVNLGLNELASYFGEHGDELHMQLSFLINEHLWLALARQQAEPLETVIRELPDVPPDSGWAVFLRNHDELTLDKLTEPQRNDVFSAFGPDKGMQLYGHGLRRRAAPMLDGDGDRLRLAWSLVFTLPGSPVILYGDEIGMGEQLELKDRLAVRVPMQWSAEPSAGFSTAPPDKLVRPLAADPFGPDKVNVDAQRRDPDSLLNWMELAIRRRKESPELGWGSVTLLETPHPSILAHRCDWEGGTILAVHNVGEEPAGATLELGDDVTGAEDVLHLREHRVGKGGRIEVELGRYGYCWLRLRRSTTPSSASSSS